MKPKVKELQSHMGDLEIFSVAELDEILSSISHHYPYHEVFQEVIWKPVLILHSSGSTGKLCSINTLLAINHADSK